jgi:ParB family chromosome partitioning protein
MTTPNIISPAHHALVALEEIEFSDKGRPYNPTEVLALKESIKAIGLQTPLTVIQRDGRYVLVAGRHRHEALRLLKAERVPVRIVDMTDMEARLWQISENLHRNELTVIQKAEHVAEWIKLKEEKLSAQLEPKGPIGHRPQSGVNAAARELGIDRNAAQRAVKVANISPAAKVALQEAKLDETRPSRSRSPHVPTTTSSRPLLRSWPSGGRRRGTPSRRSPTRRRRIMRCPTTRCFRFVACFQAAGRGRKSLWQSA